MPPLAKRGASAALVECGYENAIEREIRSRGTPMGHAVRVAGPQHLRHKGHAAHSGEQLDQVQPVSAGGPGSDHRTASAAAWRQQ